jgi:AraC-like DNA-binding protein
MKTSDKKISGVLHQKNSAQHYQLRRYLPEPILAPLIEQFWLVDWDLRGLPAHTQQNLPDPNMHLVISNQGANFDKAAVAYLSDTLENTDIQAEPSVIKVQTLAAQIKNNNEINRVEVLAKLSHTSVRSLQRLFKTYVGLSPKWLIRKYRLHHALEMLENKQLSLAQLTANLGYADQSHLIREFHAFLDVTPKQYTQKN